MTELRLHGFWSGGRTAWWNGLREAVRSAEQGVERATTEQLRQEAQAELDELKRQERHAKLTGHRWLF